MLIKYNQIIVFKIIKQVIDTVFPRYCPSCSVFLHSYEKLICLKCVHELPYHNKNNNYINDIFINESTILSSFLFDYSKNSKVKNLIHEYKYHNHIELGKHFANCQKTSLITINNDKNIDFVASVPMHKKKQRKRGYNQVNPYAQEIAKIIEALYMENLLVKVTNTKTQSKQNKKERLLNIKDSFKVNPSSIDISGKHLLIVDDLVTTGATILTIYNLLNTNYNCKISLAAIAITHLD